jgi:hypothetical protein
MRTNASTATPPIRSGSSEATCSTTHREIGLGADHEMSLGAFPGELGIIARLYHRGVSIRKDLEDGDLERMIKFRQFRSWLDLRGPFVV